MWMKYGGATEHWKVGVGRVVRHDSEASQILAILMHDLAWLGLETCHASHCYANGCDIINTLKLKMYYSTQIIFYVIHIHSGQLNATSSMSIRLWRLSVWKYRLNTLEISRTSFHARQHEK